jgi:hypothetical protein
MAGSNRDYLGFNEATKVNTTTQFKASSQKVGVVNVPKGTQKMF